MSPAVAIPPGLFRRAVVLPWMSKPLVVELTSSMAEVCGGFPLSQLLTWASIEKDNIIHTVTTMICKNDFFIGYHNYQACISMC